MLTDVDDLGGALGVSTGGRIEIVSGLPPAEEFVVLVHEFAHLCSPGGYVRSLLVSSPLHRQRQ
ncbi:MAG: hypothetical protein ACRD3J_13680 [Thermoanaerobaculia bacterium]